MYGFAESWVCNALDITERLPYSISNGQQIDIIDECSFRHMANAIEYVMANTASYGPIIEVESDISGMKLLLHNYWLNDITLDSITGSEVKQSAAYRTIRQRTSGERFSLGYISNLLSHYASNTLTLDRAVDVASCAAEADDCAAVDVEAPESIEGSEDVDVAPTELPDDTVVDHYKAIIEICCDVMDASNTNVFKGVNYCFMSDYTLPISGCNFLQELSIASNRPVVFMHSHAQQIESTISERVDRLNITDPLMKPLFITRGPNDLFVRGREMLCYGRPSFIDVVRSNPSSNKNPLAQFDRILRDTTTNTIWGAQIKNVLYILMPFGDLEPSDVFIQRILNHNLTYDEIEAMDMAIAEQTSKAAFNRYVEFAQSDSEKLIKTLIDEFEHHKSEYQKSIDAAMLHSRSMHKYNDMIKTFNATDHIESERSRIETSYKETLSIPQIRSIVVHDNVIHVYTNDIYAKDDRTGKWHNIGTFDIQIGMYSSSYDESATVKIINTKYQIPGYNGDLMQAPHVFNNGRICHGNLGLSMVNAFGRRDLYEMAMLLILFLQDANTDDMAGAYVSNWPEVSEKIATRTSTDPIYTNDEDEECDRPFDVEIQESIPVHI